MKSLYRCLPRFKPPGKKRRVLQQLYQKSTLAKTRKAFGNVTTSIPTVRPKSNPIPRRWIFAGFAVYSITGYLVYLYLNATSETAPNLVLTVPEDVSDRYNTTAGTFDRDIGNSEWIMGLLRLRKKLTKLASGNILEVSAGTGRNSSYYDLPSCKSITMVDQSPEMMEIARQKFKGEHASFLRQEQTASIAGSRTN